VKSKHTQVNVGTSSDLFRAVSADLFLPVFRLWKTLWETHGFDLLPARRMASEGFPNKTYNRLADNLLDTNGTAYFPFSGEDQDEGINFNKSRPQRPRTE
jgi:hypothetical protein